MLDEGRIRLMNSYPSRPPSDDPGERHLRPPVHPPQPSRHASEPGRELRLAARCLPLVTLAIWVTMIWIPVLDSGETSGGPSLRIVCTSIGCRPVEPTAPDPEVIAVWVLLLLSALTAWMLRSLRLWSVVAVIVGIALLVILALMVADPPMTIWDGVDSQGRPTGGMVVGLPAPGALLWMVGSLGLCAAGVCGFSGELRRTAVGTPSGRRTRSAPPAHPRGRSARS